nr:MAG TPA: tail collar fiber protein [Caudoviricetes sp.]
MESIRIGNDINIEWSILRNGDPETLEGKDLRVVMTNGYRKMEVKDLHFRDNVIRFTYLGKDQDYNGVYTLTLIENKGKEGMYTVDACDAFRLIPRSCSVGGDTGCGSVKVTTIKLTGDISVPAVGTGDYESMTNKPRINGVELVGDKSLEELGIPILPDNIVTDADYTHTDNNLTDALLEKLDGLSNYDDTALREALTSEISRAKEVEGDLDTAIRKVASDLSTFITGDPDADNIINRWQEVVEFLSGMTEDKDMAGVLLDLKKQILAEVTSILSGYYTSGQIDDRFVEKIKGKGLSTNDLTDELLSKINGLSNYDDEWVRSEIASIKADIDTLLGDGASDAIDTFHEIELFLQGITDKETLTGLLNDLRAEITALIPTKTSQLTNDDHIVKDANYVHTDNNYTDEDKGKLDGLDNYDDTDIRNLVTGLRTDVNKLKPVVTSTPSNGQITITPDKAKNDDPDVSITLETKGDKDKSLMADGKYRKLPVYGRNLLLGSGKVVSNSNYNIADYWLTEPISKGTQVTLTIFGELGDDKEMFTIYNSTGAVGSMAQFSKADFVNGKASKTFKWITNIGDAVADNTHMVVFSSPKTGTSTSTIHKIKLEYGDISTEWTPAWEDIPDIEERYAYGVEWDMASSSPDGKRVGNMQLHRELPVQSKIRGCVLDNSGGVRKYLGASSWSQEDMSIDYLLEAIMAEMDRFWIRFYIKGLKFGCMMSDTPMPGYTYINKRYMSAFEGGIDRPSMTLLSAYGVGSTNVNRRGGDNTAEWDGTYRSLLGRPVTNLTRDQFRQAARKRGSGWEMYTYNAHKILFWLFAVEYATLYSQKPFNAQKDANGFAQGGLGPGPTQMTDWTNFNNVNPLIPCGYTNEFGNGSGEKAYMVKNASGGTHATLMANRYRGIENPFGHIWKYTDGANIQVTTGDAGLSILWTTDDPSNFSDTSYTGYDKKGNICRTNGYAKKMLLGEDGDIVATEIGGSSSTYWCDYYYTYTSANRMQVVLVGGRADYGSSAGLAYVATSNAPSGASRDIGSRLCFFPEYRKTSA